MKTENAVQKGLKQKKLSRKKLQKCVGFLYEIILAHRLHHQLAVTRLNYLGQELGVANKKIAALQEQQLEWQQQMDGLCQMYGLSGKPLPTPPKAD